MRACASVTSATTIKEHKTSVSGFPTLTSTHAQSTHCFVVGSWHAETKHFLITFSVYLSGARVQARMAPIRAYAHAYYLKERKMAAPTAIENAELHRECSAVILFFFFFINKDFIKNTEESISSISLRFFTPSEWGWGLSLSLRWVVVLHFLFKKQKK